MSPLLLQSLFGHTTSWTDLGCPQVHFSICGSRVTCKSKRHLKVNTAKTESWVFTKPSYTLSEVFSVSVKITPSIQLFRLKPRIHWDSFLFHVTSIPSASCAIVSTSAVYSEFFHSHHNSSLSLQVSHSDSLLQVPHN